MSRVARRDLATEDIEIERPLGILAQLVQGHVRTRCPRDLVEALVAGPRHDGMVARAQQHVDETEDPLLGTGEDQHVVGFEAGVQRRDLATQQRMTARLGVAKGQVVPQGPSLLVRQLEHLVHRIPLHVRRTEQVLDGELPAGEVAFEGEVGDAHGRIMPEQRPRGAGPISCQAWTTQRGRAGAIVVAGSPTALGGHFAGMERGPAELRARGLLERLAAEPAFPGRRSMTMATPRTIRAGRPIRTRG